MGFPVNETPLFGGLGFEGFNEHGITDAILAHFPMDDPSSTNRSATFGRAKLSQVGGVPRVSGVSPETNFAADFNGSTQYLTDSFAYQEFAPASGGAGADGLPFPQNVVKEKIPNRWTAAGWVYLKSTSPRIPADVEDICTKWGNNVGGRGYAIQYIHSGNPNPEGFAFAFSTDGNNLVTLNYGNGSGVALDTWHHLRVSIDGTNAYMQVNNGPVQSVSHGGSGIINADDPLEFGRINIPGTLTRYAGVRVDSWSFWGRVITEAENTQIYNNGSGLGFPWAPVHALADGIQAHWAMNEFAGQAYDNTGRQRDFTGVNGSPTMGPSVVGSGRVFNSSLSQWLEISNPSWASIGQRDWTLGLRFRPAASPANNGMLIAKNNETGVGGAGSEWNLQLVNANGNVPAYLSWRVLYNQSPFEGGMIGSGVANGRLDDGEFHSVMCGHIDGSGVWMQIDGGPWETRDEVGTTQNDGNADLTIGRRDHASALYFDGTIADVTIWHRFPSAKEREFFLTGAV